jgi:hypothetical protein
MEPCAKHYVGPPYVAFDGKRIRDEQVYDKLNAQIAHLTYAREKIPANKIGGPQLTYLKQLLDSEVRLGSL